MALEAAPLASKRNGGISWDKEGTISSSGANVTGSGEEQNKCVLDYLMSLAIRGIIMRLLSATGTVQGGTQGSFY